MNDIELGHGECMLIGGIVGILFSWFAFALCAL